MKILEFSIRYYIRKVNCKKGGECKASFTGKAIWEGKNLLGEQKEKGKDGGRVRKRGGREGGSHTLVTEPGAGPKGYLIEIIRKSGTVGGG